MVSRLAKASSIEAHPAWPCWLCNRRWVWEGRCLTDNRHNAWLMVEEWKVSEIGQSIFTHIHYRNVLKESYTSPEGISPYLSLLKAEETALYSQAVFCLDKRICVKLQCTRTKASCLHFSMKCTPLTCLVMSIIWLLLLITVSSEYHRHCSLSDSLGFVRRKTLGGFQA